MSRDSKFEVLNGRAAELSRANRPRGKKVR